MITVVITDCRILYSARTPEKALDKLMAYVQDTADLGDRYIMPDRQEILSDLVMTNRARIYVNGRHYAIETIDPED